MSYAAKSPEELALDEHTSDTDDLVAGFIDDDEGVVGPRGWADGVELGYPFRFAGVGDNG